MSWPSGPSMTRGTIESCSTASRAAQVPFPGGLGAFVMTSDFEFRGSLVAHHRRSLTPKPCSIRLETGYGARWQGPDDGCALLPTQNLLPSWTYEAKRGT